MAEPLPFADIDGGLAVVDAREAEDTPRNAWHLDRHATLDRLRDVIRNPSVFDQRGLNAGGAAVFFRVWLPRDPVSAANFACNMSRDGAADSYQTVDNDTKVVGPDTNGPIPELNGPVYPDHYVLMAGQSLLGNEFGWNYLNCWTWGSYRLGWQSNESFFANYYGPIRAST